MFYNIFLNFIPIILIYKTSVASIKLKYRPSSVVDKEGVIYYQIIHRRIPRQIITDYHIKCEEWNNKRSCIVAPFDCNRISYLSSLRERIRCDLERLSRIIKKMDTTVLEYSADDVVEEFKRYSREYSLFNFSESVIARLRQRANYGTADNYRATLNSLKKYCNDRDIMLDSITKEFVNDYEVWLKNRGVCMNTVSFYMRILRAIYRRAVDAEIIENRAPFRNVYTGIDKTVKRALPLNIIRKIRSLDLSTSPYLNHARNMFLMSFYLRGMSFVDMAYLKKSDLKGGFITYRRRKTGQRLTIAWVKEMQEILDSYPDTEGKYLFHLISSKCINERSAYKNASFKINKNLKKIGEMVGAPGALTMYTARHSWASLAKLSGIPIGVISEAMGHESELTTRIYLASLETSVIDSANERVISLLS